VEQPKVVDVYRAESQDPQTYDLPLHYQGHIVELGFPVEGRVTTRPVLGDANGYQHIWVDGTSMPTAGDAAMTWLLDGRFYTYRFVADGALEVILGESGANDPHFNLRREPLLIQRVKAANGTTFVSVLETHGLYDGGAERTVGSRSRIASLRHVNKGGYDLVIVEALSGDKSVIAISYEDDPKRVHRAIVDGRKITWRGFVARAPLESGEK